jgi:hypothetical protein
LGLFFCENIFTVAVNLTFSYFFFNFFEKFELFLPFTDLECEKWEANKIFDFSFVWQENNNNGDHELVGLLKKPNIDEEGSLGDSKSAEEDTLPRMRF